MYSQSALQNISSIETLVQFWTAFLPYTSSELGILGIDVATAEIEKHFVNSLKLYTEKFFEKDNALPFPPESLIASVCKHLREGRLQGDVNAPSLEQLISRYINLVYSEDKIAKLEATLRTKILLAK